MGLFEKNGKPKGGVKMAGNLPIKKWRAGNIECCIWSNKRVVNGNEVEFKTLTLGRGWMDKEKNIWRNENINCRRGDIAKLLVVLNEAQKELFLDQESKEDEEEE